MNLFFLNNKKALKWIISLSFVMFLFSNSVVIKRGMCSSSPCSDFNNSHRVARPGYDDTFMESYSLPFLAPSSFLLTKFLNEDVYEFYSNPINLTLDYKVDSEGVAYGRYKTLRDSNDFTRTFLFVKFIIFLSFPIWICISFLLYKIYSRNRKIGITIIVILFMVFGIMKLFISFDLFNFDHDGDNVTFRHLFLRK